MERFRAVQVYRAMMKELRRRVAGDPPDEVPALGFGELAIIVRPPAPVDFADSLDAAIDAHLRYLSDSLAEGWGGGQEE